jgi:hypothetical protein
MTDQHAEGVRIRHVSHDRHLIAAFASGDLAGRDLTRATALVRDCPDCAALAADLHSIAIATRRLPTSLPAARDFRLSPADVDRLRAGGWRRLFRVPVVSRWSTQPLGAALTTLGVAGLLLAAMPFMSLGSPSGGSAPRDNAQTTSGEAKAATTAIPTLSPAVTVGPSGNIDAAGSAQPGVPEFGALPDDTPSNGPCCATEAPGAIVLTPAPSLVPEASTPTPVPQGGTVPLVVLSAVLLLAGIGLLAAGRRSTLGR